MALAKVTKDEKEGERNKRVETEFGDSEMVFSEGGRHGTRISVHWAEKTETKMVKMEKMGRVLWELRCMSV